MQAWTDIPQNGFCTAGNASIGKRSSKQYNSFPVTGETWGHVKLLEGKNNGAKTIFEQAINASTEGREA